MRFTGKCPSCGGKVSPEDFLCPNCELILDASKLPSQPPAVTEVSVVRRMLEVPQRGLPGVAPPAQPTRNSADATRVLALPPEVNGVPIVVASLTKKAMALSDLEAYVVSLIDGQSELPALAKKAGVGELELRVVLHSLNEKMIVDFADAPLPDEPLPALPPEAPPPLTEDEPLALAPPPGIVEGTALPDATPPLPIVAGTLPSADATPPPPPARVPPRATNPPPRRGAAPPRGSQPRAPAQRPQADATPPPPPPRVRPPEPGATPPPPPRAPAAGATPPPPAAPNRRGAARPAPPRPPPLDVAPPPPPPQAQERPPAPPPDALEEAPAPAPPPPPPSIAPAPPPRAERTDPRIAYGAKVNRKVLDALKQVKRREGAAEPPPAAAADTPAVNVADVHAEPSLQVALRMEQNGRFNEAIRFLENAIAKSPDAPSLYNRLAIILMRERADFRRAEAMMRKALELDPENRVYAMNLTQVLSRAAMKSQKR